MKPSASTPALRPTSSAMGGAMPVPEHGSLTDNVIADSDLHVMEPPDLWQFPLLFTWGLPPLPKGPDLLLLATELAGIGGPDLPLEVSAIDSTASVTEATERSLSIVGRIEVSLSRIFLGQEQLCDTLDRCLAVSHYLLERAPAWLDERLRTPGAAGTPRR